MDDNPTNLNAIASHLRVAVNNLAPPVVIVVNNARTKVVPDDWSDANAHSYTIEFRGRKFYMFVAEFDANVVIIWLQDASFRESFEARPVFVNLLPQLKEHPTQADLDDEDELVGTIMSEFSSFFFHFLSCAAAGKKPHRRPFGSSTCSSMNSS